MDGRKRNSPEVLERAVGLLFDHENSFRLWRAATMSITSKNVCTSETLRAWTSEVESKPVAGTVHHLF